MSVSPLLNMSRLGLYTFTLLYYMYRNFMDLRIKHYLNKRVYYLYIHSTVNEFYYLLFLCNDQDILTNEFLNHQNLSLIYLQAAWTLKTRALTGQVYVDEVDVDEEGIAEMVMDDNTIAQVSRPGTSLKQPGTGRGAPSQGVR